MGLLNKKGTRVHIETPIKTTFEVETDDTRFAVAFALNLAKGRYPSENWANFKYTTSEYTYKDINLRI